MKSISYLHFDVMRLTFEARSLDAIYSRATIEALELAKFGLLTWGCKDGMPLRIPLTSSIRIILKACPFE